MAKKSVGGVDLGTLLVLGLGGYFVYNNWPAISSWLTSMAAGVSSAVAPIGTAAASGSAYYPNSPVPLTFSTSQTFVDSSGNQWQFSTQTGQWVIATPAASPTPALTPISSTSVSPAETVVPASAGTLVPLGPVASTPPAVATMPPTSSQQGPGLTVETGQGPITWGLPSPGTPGPPGTEYILMGPRALPIAHIVRGAQLVPPAT